MDNNIEKSMSDVADKAVEKLAAGSAQMYGDLKSVVEYAKEHAPDAWAIMVRQQRIEGWTSIIAWTVLVLACVLGTYLCYRSYKNGVENDGKAGKRHESDSTVLFYVTSIISAIVAFTMICISCYFVAVGVQQIINPEYFAGVKVCQMVTGHQCGEN